MSKVRVHISTSLDGYVAGPNQSQEEPLGEGGEHLHDWLVELRAWREPQGMEGGEENASTAVVAETFDNVGAEIMGRGKFGPANRGPVGRDPWQGWWGDDPPFHKPVFVVTHTTRATMLSDTTTPSSPTESSPRWRRRVKPPATRTSSSAGEPTSSTSTWPRTRGRDRAPRRPDPPGGGARLFAGVGQDVKLELLRVVEAPGVTHLKYRVVK